ncbi:unnamed protein product (macronuclear) [Paramecium tetraurelia]|uniref:Chromosome undetermined scaffold_1, whole genome shotgun sequence n=1 Tax=Paramecium tetraurelia TaxID=5888 RepID=Q6BG44_PARTE|nr:hypothetical protein [Paramecium tetraurelia strain d4-2]XP_001423307.1 uncharacterized protein GSPATT00000344001 [Paramecium tetraurelia]CAH03376.1 hypothetical protein with coiled-coil domains [Paramecium tetraurelia]CAK55909.1 unnamed protein product [Paramecium tetraurelia]|eukprot:XP_001423307.1 hypothetical protein (macronuclear) [Paramecium tetraurelia strain d4-2]
MFEMQEELSNGDIAQVQDSNQLRLSKRQSFKSDTILQWNALQENLQLQYNLLNKENETKNERIQILLNTTEKYYQTQLRYKDLRRMYNQQQANNYNQKQCILGFKFDNYHSEIQKFLFLLMENQELFAQLIHSSLDVGVHNLDEFIFDILTFLYDPIVGAGLQEGVFKLLSELLKLELIDLKNPLELFQDKNNLVCKFLIGFSKGPLCQSYIQQICGQALNLLMNVKEELQLNPKIIYESQLKLKESKESAKLLKLKQENKARKIMFNIIPMLMQGTEENKDINVYENVRRTNIPEYILNAIMEQISPAIQSYCQTPLQRIMDPQLLEETAKILYDRHKVTEMIINSICDNILNSLHNLPFMIRALCRLQYQIFKVLYQSYKQEEIFNLLIQFFINKWILPEFTAMFLNQQQLESSQYQTSNIAAISKILLSVWKGEAIEGLNISLNNENVFNYFKELIELPPTQLNFYIKEKSEKHFISYLLSISDLQILLNTISKSRIEGSLGGKQLTRYTDLRELADCIMRYNQKMGSDFMSNHVQWKGQKVQANNMHFSVHRLSDLYNVNYIDIAFKFTEKFSAQDKEELLFISKAKQVVAQFLISIERISLLSKLRNNIILSFDNLIYMYKDSYENKGQIIKQYENISPQLYANYLLSIYKMIPNQYTSNNLSLLCQEMIQEFDQKVTNAKNQQKAMLEAFLKIITQLQTERREIKALNKQLKTIELKKKLNYFLKNVKIPCLLSFRYGQINLISIQDTSKTKSLDPKDNEKQQFLQIVNGADLNSLQLELPFQSIRDFIDILSGLKHLQLALEGDQVFIEIVQKLFQSYMKLVEERLEQQSFFPQNQNVKKNNQYIDLCYETAEKSVVRRIMMKYCTVNEIKEDQPFIEQCQKKLIHLEEQQEVKICLSELPMLIKMSESFRQIDQVITPIEKLQMISNCLSNLSLLLKISGIDDNPGQDGTLPVFIYLVAQACPKFMKTNLNIIQSLFNFDRWKNSTYPFSSTQLQGAYENIMS